MRGLKSIGISLVLLTSVSCQSRYFRTNLAGRVYPADYDRNGDGITDIQAIRAGFDPADPTLANQDPDGDGLTNYWEFKLGFDPKKADSDNTIYNKQTGGNGTSDCDEDLVGDGIGVCWKLKNKFKPTEGNRSLTDADGDAYSDGEEYVANTDPNDATKRPAGGTPGSDGKLPPVLSIKGTNASYTTSLNITGTMSYCAAGEKVLFTSSKTKPGVDDAGFVDCTTTADALVGTLASGTSGNRVMFAWRKIAAGVVEVPLSASILYTNRASAGGLDVIPAGDKTLAVALVPPSDAHYGSVKLLRFPDFDCSSKTLTSSGSTDTPVTPGDSLVTVTNLPLGSSYCFKVFWTDDKGNTITAHGGYDGTPPPAGTFSITGYATKTIKFAHTPPTSPKYEKLVVRRFEEQTCTTKLASEGTEVPVPMTATTYDDTNLSFGTPYCYKVFWSDSLGNNNSTTVSYAGPPTGGDLSLLGMQKTGASSGSVELRLIRPTPVPTTTTLKRYEDSTCTALSSTDISPTGTIGATYDKSDSVTGFKTYCYKAAWSDDFGNSQTDTVVAQFYPPSISIAPTSLTFTAPGGGNTDTANATGSVAYTANSFNSIFTNAVAGLTALLGNGAGSILSGTTATVAESDIPGLTYSTASGCETSTATVFCNTDNASGTVTGAGYNLVSNGVLNWNYTKFDQGDYTIRTMGRLNLDGAKYYSKASDGVISVQTDNLGNEEVVFSDGSTSINESFSALSSWARYSPSIALSDRISDGTKQLYGIAYSAFKSGKNQYFNTISLDYSANFSSMFKKGFDSSTDPTVRLNNTLKDDFRTALSPADTTYSTIVSGVGTSTNSRDWLILGNVVGQLQLTVFNQSSNLNEPDSNSVSRISLGNGSGTVTFGSSSITGAYNDNSNNHITPRHGVVFSAYASGKYGVYATKIRSSATSLDRLGFLDTYSNNNSNVALPESITLKGNLPYEPDQLKITTSNESGTNIFYAGWRVKANSSDTDRKLFFAKLVADGTSAPTVYQTKASDIIGDMGVPAADGGWGRASYSIAAGQTSDSNPIDILGVVYSAASADGNNHYKCKFRAYKIDSSELTRIGASDIDIDFTTPSNDCRFVNLFWNSHSKKFMVVWAEGAEPPTNPTPTQAESDAYYFGPTYYAEFKYATLATPMMTDTKQVIVTKERQGLQNKLICNMGASFANSSTPTVIPKISIVTIESSECQTKTADMKVDFYKP